MMKKREQGHGNKQEGNYGYIDWLEEEKILEARCMKEERKEIDKDWVREEAYCR